MTFPNKNDLQQFTIEVLPDEGMYTRGSFKFQFIIPDSYPFEPPKVKCLAKIYHPNIDLQGNICLNILREDWKPVLNVNAVLHGLLFLFYEPNPNDPLNQDAAKVLRTNPQRFTSNVSRTMRGGEVDGHYYDNVIRR
ncbi:NEDD8-conjugating enzyme UBC12 [Sphaeroforma arctica JP610]|uniref:NEDD8-conjugating enzyme UBC12 n=1 Tax=Sphaeroforma arctica JP610 TaxID=667725 RepID=A0A0L0FGG2_9EUKA|nr:NEDD8-conjugating enzyme UBC12 [Sphaeroforma arctica JP610]KNC75113.1 NEDD8-conjugating enzyme UBC12 [Sphaeroforma arctica JP610]|eukprot:XP_014149015.1 NEDD8-conjugating enzyme UBC12 [Sphaeroforma arctica JP610]